MKNLINQLTFSWSLDGVIANSGLNTSAIEQLEETIGYHFPLDFKQYLQKVDGMAQGEADENLFYFWDHAIIQEELGLAHKQNKNSIYIAFADRIVIESVYFIELSKQPQRTGKVGIKKRDFKLIAPSFEAFIADYLNRIEKKLMIWEDTSERDDDSNMFSLSSISNNIKSYLGTLATPLS